jgi:hypothetical protein
VYLRTNPAEKEGPWFDNMLAEEKGELGTIHATPTCSSSSAFPINPQSYLVSFTELMFTNLLALF